MDINRLRELIANDATEESLDELYALATEKNYEMQNTIIQLRRKFKEVKGAEMSGTLSFQEASQEKAKINSSILELLSELANSGSKKQPPAKLTASAAPAPQAPSMSTKKVVLIVVVTIVVILLLLILFSDIFLVEESLEEEF
jgi:CHASE3 domain sensor protein